MLLFHAQSLALGPPLVVACDVSLGDAYKGSQAEARLVVTWTRQGRSCNKSSATNPRKPPLSLDKKSLFGKIPEAKKPALGRVEVLP